MNDYSPLGNIACVACGNEGVQKVSSIVNSNTWGENTVGNYSGSSVGAAVGLGRARGSNALVVSSNSGTTAAQTLGGTHQARVLTPPPAPYIAYTTPFIVKFARFFVVITVILALIAQNSYNDGGRPTTILVLYTALSLAATIALCPLAYSISSKKKIRIREEMESQTRRWEEAMMRWDNLFYCPRCDNVYFPQTSTFVPPDRMYTLL